MVPARWPSSTSAWRTHLRDPLGGHPDAASFAQEYYGPTGDPKWPMGWRWPPNAGAVPGTEHTVTPGAGTVVDRIGGMGGEYFSPRDTPFGERSLPPDRVSLQRRYWEIDESHPDLASGRLRLEESRIAPWFGQPGGGQQYRFLDAEGNPLKAFELEQRGIIRERTHD